MLKITGGGILLPVKITPKAHQNEIVGWENNELKVKITAIPEKGGANRALIKFLAHFLSVSASQIELISGQTSRHKRLIIKGIDLEGLQNKLPPAMDT